MTSRVAVAADSSAGLSQALASAWGIGVVPLQVAWGDVSLREGVDATASDVLAALLAGHAVTTSQPSVASLREAIADAQAAGAEHLVFVALSAALSGTVSTMTAVAQDAPIPVTVVDTRTVSLAAGFAALSAAAVAKEGGTAAQVADEAQRVAASSSCVFTVDTLEYLRRGGRLSAPAAMMGDALGVKPVLAVADGVISTVAKVRSTARARDAVIAHATATAVSHRACGVMTLPRDDDAARAAAATLTQRGERAVVTASLSAALAAHTGPGMIAVATADVHPAVFAALAAQPD